MGILLARRGLLALVVLSVLSIGACCLQAGPEGQTGTSGSGSASGSGGSTGSAPPTGPAYVMIVQDLSGSMCEPIQATAPSGQSCLSSQGPVTKGYCSVCSPGSGTCTDAVHCASQLQLTSGAVTSVLGNLKLTRGQLFLGLASFPSANSTCGTGSVQIPVGAALDTLPKILQLYGAAAPSGGAPMAATLAVAATDPALSNPDPTARKFILLVTDGLPNCAASSACTTTPWSDGQPWGCASPSLVAAKSPGAMPPAGCACSFGSCATDASLSLCCPVEVQQPNEATFCLDDQSTEAEIGKLYATQNITTYVLGTGYDYASDSSVLNAMAAAGHGSATALQAKVPGALAALFTINVPASDGGH